MRRFRFIPQFMVWFAVALAGSAARAGIPIGPIGGDVDIVLNANQLKVNAVTAGAPGALGGLQAGDYIFAAFGEAFGVTGSSGSSGYVGALIDLAEAIDWAERNGGTLPLSVIRPGAGTVQLTISLPAAGAYGAAYPAGPGKYDARFDQVCDAIQARIAAGRRDSYVTPLFGLILMGHGDAKYDATVETIKDYLKDNPSDTGSPNDGRMPASVLTPLESGTPDDGLNNWGYAATLMFLSEYESLHPGADPVVAAAIDHLALGLGNRVQDWQQPSYDGYAPLKLGMMGHGGVQGDYPHVSYSGLNIINAHVLAALAMAGRAGADFSRATTSAQVPARTISEKFLACYQRCRDSMNLDGVGSADDGNIGYGWWQGGYDSSGRTGGTIFGMRSHGLGADPLYEPYLLRMEDYIVRQWQRTLHSHAYTVGGQFLTYFSLHTFPDAKQRYVLDRLSYYHTLQRAPGSDVPYVPGRENNGGDSYLNNNDSARINYGIAGAVFRGNLPSFPAGRTSRIHLDTVSPRTRLAGVGLRKLTITTSAVTLTATATDHLGAALGTGDYTAAWTNVSGPAAAVFSAEDEPSTQVTVPASGKYVVRLTATRGLESVTQDYEITAQLTPPPAGILMGRANAHIWTGVSGASVAALTSLGTYPATPNIKTTTTVLSSAASGSSYGQRIFGYIVPPTTGAYTFRIASDDASEFWLNTSGSTPAGKAKICYLSNWVGRYNWTAYASQTSPAYNLTEGVAYYFEILHKEDGGADHVDVAWTGPGIASPTVIASEYIGIDAAAAAVPTITQQPAGVTGVLGGSATLTVGHNEVLGPLIYQWRLNGMPLWPASSSPHLSLANLSGGMAGNYDVIITSPEGTVTSASAALTLSDAGAITAGGLWQEVFEDIAGSEVSAMTGEDRYPFIADSSAVLSPAESISGFSDDYGQRITGWITPAVSGNYRLMVASDDHCELWLSTDKYPVHKVKIAERTSGYTSYRSWSSAVKSAYLPLVAGQKYYVEILHKEGGGGDHCSLNWQKQGDATPANGSAPLAGSFLSYRRGGVHDDYVFPLIQTQPAAQSGSAGGSATFSVVALGPGLTYQWRRNGIAVPGGTGPTLTLHNLGPADAGSYTVVIANTAATETSAAATLTVSTTAVTDWLATYGLSGAGLAADSDGDGWTNEQEYYAGTVPNSAGSQLAPLDVTRAGSTTARLRWTSPHDGLAPASAYTLYAQDASFTNSSAAWTQRVRGITRQGNETEYDDNLATLDGLRVYAIRPTGVTGGPAPALLAVHRAVLPAGRQTWVSFPITASSMALQDLLPEDSLPAGATESAATVIDLWNAATQSFATRYWLSSNPSYPGWRTSGTFLDAGATVLDPAMGVAITIRAGQGDQAVVITGTVPQDASATRNLAAGYNLLSLAFPTSTTLAAANLTGSGFNGATRFTTSDLLLVPDAAGAFSAQYWYNTASSSWVNLSGGGNADNALIPAGRPLLILRRGGVFSWSNPRPYTLPLRGP